MKPLTKTNRTMRELLLANKRAEIPVWLGNLHTGEKKADENGNIYVTFMDTGDVATVYNDIAPLILKLQVVVGYDKANPSFLRVLRMREQFAQKPFMDLPNHAKTHQWPGHDTLFIRREQWASGLVLPIAGTLTVKLLADDYYLNDGWHRWSDQVLDLTSQIPTSGANFVLVEIDDAQVLSYTAGATVDSRDVLQYSDIPSVTSGKYPVAILKVYLGQAEFIQSEFDTDILDARFAFRGSGPLPLLDDYRIVVTDVDGRILAAPAFWFNKYEADYTGQWYHGYDSPRVIGNNAEVQVNIDESTLKHMYTISNTLTHANGIRFSRGQNNGSDEPAKMLANMVIGYIRGAGYYNEVGDPAAEGNSSVSIEIVATEDWDATSRPAEIRIYTTESGSTVRTLRGRFTDNGDFDLETGGQFTIGGVPIGGGGTTIPIVTSDPGSPADGDLWMLRETVAPADGEPIGLLLALTYTGNPGVTLPLRLSVYDDGVTRRLQFI